MLRGVRCRRHRRAEAVLKYPRRPPEPQCVGERVREAEGRGDRVGPRKPSFGMCSTVSVKTEC